MLSFNKPITEIIRYGMEAIILHATSLGLGTCWLGGNFTKSSFARKIRAAREEIVPAVTATGYAVEGIRTRDWQRRVVKSDRRQPWERLFFRSGAQGESAELPLSQEDAGAYVHPLETVRLAPSSHNAQPWRVVLDSGCYHFCLKRTGLYGPGTQNVFDP